MGKKHYLLYFIPALIFLSSYFIFSKNADAETQQELRCYSECGVYKFAWVGDVCFDIVQNNCTIDSGSMASKAVSFIKDAYNLVKTNELTMLIGVSDVFKAWFICKPLIEECIVPQLNSCKTVCDVDPYFYSPNVSVGSPSSTYLHGVYYNDQEKKLYFKAINNGLGYAWNIRADASWGHTPNRDGRVSGDGTLFDEQIPELLFLGSRQGSPPTAGSVVVDFLIDESNFSNFLSQFKSDADQKYIPPLWEKVINFNAPDGELTKVIFNVDSGQYIPESNENDNTYILEIDKRPAPAKFEFENINIEIVQNTLTDFNVDVKVKNTGEENGQATLEWYEGDYKSGNSPLYSANEEIDGGESRIFSRQVTVDSSAGLPSCQKTKKFSLILKDPYEGISTSYFDIPLYAGQISGNIKNLQDKNLENAIVTLSTGETTKTNKYGNYNFKGITRLGNITITASHPEYTQSTSKEINMVFNPGDTLQTRCSIPGLAHTNVDFVIKNEPVLLNITLKNRDGANLSGTVNMSCERQFRDFEINGQANFYDLQPEKCQFTASSNGYISQSQTIMLTAPSQNIEFILTKLLGRGTDKGLSIHTPQLLWEKELPDEEFISDIAASKDGKLLVFYASNSHNKYATLYFLDPQRGTEIKKAAAPYTTVAQGFARVDSSYDGRTIGLMVKPPANPSKADSQVILFNALGQQYNSTTIERQYAVGMEVSPDGTYIYANQLMDNSLHKFTRGEILGYENSREHMLLPKSEAIFFTKNNNFISRYKNELEVLNFKLQSIKSIGNIRGVSRNIDVSNSENEVLVRTDNDLYYFSPQNNWIQNVVRDSRHVSASISVGGEYALVTEGNGGGEWLKLKIYDSKGQDVTPQFYYKDVIFVTADDTGLYYLSASGEKLAYYKIGSYDTEYAPEEEAQPEEGQYLVGDLQKYNTDSQLFEDIEAVSWLEISGTQLYKATKRITFQTEFGNISFTKDTVFTRFDITPIVLYGQAQIHATKPISMILIRIKQFDPKTMYEKLYAFYNNRLSQNEHVVAKNLHTKYTAESDKEVIKVAVQEGSVSVKFLDKETIVNHKQILTIDSNGQVKIKKYYPYLIIYLILAVAFFTSMFIFLKKIMFTIIKKLKERK